MLDGDAVFGVICVEHYNRDAFSNQDARNLELLAPQAAIAILNAQQFEEILELSEANRSLCLIFRMICALLQLVSGDTSKTYTIADTIV